MCESGRACAWATASEASACVAARPSHCAASLFPFLISPKPFFSLPPHLSPPPKSSSISPISILTETWTGGSFFFLYRRSLLLLQTFPWTRVLRPDRSPVALVFIPRFYHKQSLPVLPASPFERFSSLRLARFIAISVRLCASPGVSTLRRPSFWPGHFFPFSSAFTVQQKFCDRSIRHFRTANFRRSLHSLGFSSTSLFSP